jgi:long-chain acyl-CoA synthetase
LTETAPVLTCNRPGSQRLGSVGKAIPGVEIKIADDGEIWARGPNVMAGYWNKRAETEECMTKDGWFKTGDIGRKDEDGFVFITDRKKEIIVMSNGKKVTPQPIENDLKTKPHVAQAVLIGNARNYITALLVPNFESLATWAKENKIQATDNVALIQDPKVQELMRKNVEEVNSTLARYEQLKKFRLLPRELSMEEDELTPSMKVKRRVVDTKFKNLLEEMYKE